MATTTTNLGLTKPDYTDAADIAVINTNMDTVDTAITATNTAITATKSDLGIVEDGNTATHSITAGQYVIWKGNLYTAKSAIATGTTLSTSNLTAVSNGGLNSLNEQIGSLQTTVSNKSNSIMVREVQSGGSGTIAPGGNVTMSANAAYSGWTPIAVVGIWGSGTSAFALAELFIDGTTAKAYYRNVKNSSDSMNYVMFKVLYVKN